MNVDDANPEPDFSEFVEVDPTGRYGRYNEILGKGSSKTVYKAFDEYEGIEVAWNQVKLHDFLQSPDDLERLYCEIHLLKTLKHENIMKLYASWVDSANRNINFVTEMFTSGTLRQYRLKHRRVNIRAVKHWCRQILRGLVYLHSRDPPVIHRDLKCDNIFVNGNQGEVKIGDLGLAAILRKSHAARCVGTPEFMAPEVYEEEYNELVDIYAFGMCVLEMVTFEYPYSECSHPAQIYKKVISGKKPESLYKVKDPEVREFVEKCLATVSLRFSASELLEDPFLRVDDYCADLKAIEHSDYRDGALVLKQPVYDFNYSSCSSLINSYSNYPGYDLENDIDYHEFDFDASEIGLFTSQDDEDLEDGDIAIKGRRREDDGIFLRLRIADKGRIRNIYFPFDIESDTALSVASEMVSELDIPDQDVTKIADMIDGEIASLVPDWKTKVRESDANFCHNCPSNGYLSDHVSPNNDGDKNLQVLNSSDEGFHGRFEEITYKVKRTEECDTEVAEADIHYAEIWAQREGGPEISSRDSMDVNCDDKESPPQLIQGDEERTFKVQSRRKFRVRRSFSVNYVPDPDFVDDYENEIRKELRWLKLKYQMQLREHRDHNKGTPLRATTEKSKRVVLIPLPSGNKLLEKKSFHLTNQGVENSESSDVLSSDFSPEGVFNAKSFCASELPPHPLHRAASLPFDAVDV